VLLLPSVFAALAVAVLGGPKRGKPGQGQGVSDMNKLGPGQGS